MRHYALKGLRIFAIINYFTESSCKKFYFSKCRLIFLTLKFTKMFMFKVRYPHIYFFSIFKCEKKIAGRKKYLGFFFVKVNILKIGMYLEICYYRCKFGNMSSNSSQPSESHYCKLQEAFLPCCCPLKIYIMRLTLTCMWGSSKKSFSLIHDSSLPAFTSSKSTPDQC